MVLVLVSINPCIFHDITAVKDILFLTVKSVTYLYHALKSTLVNNFRAYSINKIFCASLLVRFIDDATRDHAREISITA